MLVTGLMLAAILAGVVGPGDGIASAVDNGPTLSIDALVDVHPISPLIYGWANYGVTQSLATELRIPVERWGGDATTRYNWEDDSSNSGLDWYYMSGGNSDPVPSSSADAVVQKDEASGGQTLMTIPIIPWINNSAVTNCSYPTAVYGPQQSVNPYVTLTGGSQCGNGFTTSGAQIADTTITSNNMANTPAFQAAWVQHLVSTFGTAANGGVGLYEMDNEPSGWDNTHRDVHPANTGWDELLGDTEEYAAAVKAVDPTAAIDGPGDFGWAAYVDDGAPGDDRASHGGSIWEAEYYLQQMAAYQAAHGYRLLDYFDEHYYPTTPSGVDGCIALCEATDANNEAARLESTRSLWDPTYVENDWIGEWYGAIDLIPRMKSWVSQYYPGTKTAISEYNFGALDSLNGALTEADVLGIFGAQGLDMADLWSPPTVGQPGAFAFQMYRNYDGDGNGFGDSSVEAQSSDQGQLSIYAATRTSDGALTVMLINKTSDDLTSPLSISGFGAGSTAEVYTYDADNLSAIVQQPSQTVSSNSLTMTYPASSITLLVIPPADVPSAPGIGSATSGNGDATLSFSAPSSDGGSAVSSYTVTAYDAANPDYGGETATGAGSPITVGGLTNGLHYTFTVSATNGSGTGPASASSNSVTPITVPSPPTIGTALAGDHAASVAFVPPVPAAQGGSPVTSYTVTATDSTAAARGGETASGTTSPVVVPGLTDGDSYTFTVTATNDAGASLASGASNSVTPAEVPGPPTIGTATAGAGEASVAFSAPASNGTSPVTGYTVTASDSTTPANGGETASGSGSPIVVPGLSDGDSYTFTVTATNGAGAGLPSAASNRVTPVTVPPAPTISAATASNGEATIYYAPSVSDGGSPVTSYTITATDSTDPSRGGETASSAATYDTINGLTDGDEYTFTVTATNTDGTGAASAASSSVTPRTVPGAPTIGSATAGSGEATVSFGAPASDGGSLVTGYTVTATDSTTSANGGETASGTTSPITVSGLTGGDRYTFKVTATNAVGSGPSSAASNSVIPGTAETTTSTLASTTTSSSTTSTTRAPTTSAPTTSAPTTSAPTTSAPATSAPATSPPTTGPPRTTLAPATTVASPDGDAPTTTAAPAASIPVSTGTPAAVLTVTAVRPDHLEQGVRRRTFSVRGRGFGPGATVAVTGSGIELISVRVVGSGMIVATASVGSDATAGRRSVMVTVSGSTATCAECLTIRPRPHVHARRHRSRRSAHATLAMANEVGSLVASGTAPRRWG